ncbi:MAG: hypothetical protein FJ109_11315 [Deltaproteobacteria bacterium]|nr:hypothetical protein [Deltaproteobacteria bacterium]
MNDEKLRPPQETGTPPPEDRADAPANPAAETAPPPAAETAPAAAPVKAAADALPASVTALINEYERTVRWNSLIRVIFPVFVLSVIVVFLLVTVLGVMSAFPEKRVTAETVKAGEEILPVLNKVLRTFVDEVAPQLADEFKRGLEKGSEKLAESLSQEIERMEKKTQEFVKTKIHDTITAARRDHRRMLLEALPELKDDPARLEKLTERVNRAFELWTVAYMLRILEDYYLAMAKINDTVIKSFQPDPKAAAASGTQESEMLELFMELMNAAYEQDLTGGPEQPNPAAPTEGTAPPAEGTPTPPAEGTPAPPAGEAATPPAETAAASTNPTNP